MLLELMQWDVQQNALTIRAIIKMEEVIRIKFVLGIVNLLFG